MPTIGEQQQTWCGICIWIFSLILLRLSGLSGHDFVPSRDLRPAPRQRVRLNAAERKEYKINQEIRANEVRVVGISGGEYGQIEDTNEIMSFNAALEKAENMGLDVILINEDQDPPLVKIASIGKYLYQESKKKKEQGKNKQPKMKEVKISYTIGDHDLFTRIRAIEQWVENPRQQVKVQVVLKGRSRMFENQARQLLERIRREVAAFAKVPGVEKNIDPINKDGRGDLFILLGSGPDRSLLKKIIEEAGGKKALQQDADKDEVEEPAPEKEVRSSAKEADEVKRIEEEIKEMRKELIDCGVNPGKVNEEPEIQDLYKDLQKAKAAAKVRS
ncbi:unnamed protein product [Durusdinium trenchii]|uniref:Translation initiation factor IF-3 n=1 Tax=Durusdinium trenchii TaxID=1381693 RepID=A0ABP0HJT4_9DINO